MEIMRSHPREKKGRNDPCPCGSGRKYKHCCLSSVAVPTESPWSRQHEATDRISSEMLSLAAREFGDDLFDAWADFNQVEIPEPIDQFPHEEAIFNPYLIFDWDPERPARRRGSKPRAGVIAQSYMGKAAKRLSPFDFLILEQAISRPISFYEVVRCDPGRTAVLRDILIGEETEVEEHTATKSMRPGYLCYGQIWILPDVASLGRLAPDLIPPERKVEIVELRAKLRRKIAKQNRELSAADLTRYAEEIRTVYLNIRDALRRPPKLANTDGEPVIFHTLTFRIGSAQVAFDALAPLAWGMTKEDLLQGVEWNRDGSLESVEIPWTVKGNPMHKTWENTILGHLKISWRSLVVEVNSANRAKRIRQEIEKRLGLHATHLSTTAQKPEEMLKERRSRGEMAPRKAEVDDEPLDPEAMREFAVQMQEEVEGWVHRKIPVLGGRTPLEAIADPDGREMVEALLLGWERRYENPGEPGSFRPDIDAVRRLLKLPV